MTDESLLLDALAAWHADRTRPAAELLPGRPDLAPRLATDIRKVLEVESAAGTPPPTDPDETTDPDGDDADPDDLLDPPTHPGDIGSVASYRVTRVLGFGGMGAVFAATDSSDTPLALKLIRSGGRRPSRAAIARFKRENDALRAINHPGVVSAIAVAEHRRAPVLVMRRLYGETLEDRLRRYPNGMPHETADVAYALTDALLAVHDAGYVHRDLKPSNVWVSCLPFATDPDDWAGDMARSYQLIDFGLTRLVDAGDKLTATGQLLGTPAYMAPEQADGQPADIRADLFSLGCVLYRQATGRPPFVGRSVPQLLLAVQTYHPPAPRTVQPDVPQAMCELIRSLMAKSPADRPVSAAVVHANFPEYLAGPSSFLVSRAVSMPICPLPYDAEELDWLGVRINHNKPLPPPERGMIARLRRLIGRRADGDRPQAPRKRSRVAPLRLADFQLYSRAGGVTANLVLSRPGHAYIVAFTADGWRPIHQPAAGPTAEPRLSVRGASADVPAGFTAVIAFLSDDPHSSAWDQSHDSTDSPPWPPPNAPTALDGVVWGSHQRGPTEQRDGITRYLTATTDSPAAALVSITDWFRRRPGVADVAAVGLVVG